MGRRSRRRPVVPDAGRSLDAFKAQVMRREGYAVDPQNPDSVKYEVARTLGVPLKPGYNGQLTTEDAGRVGGQIGGSMVREMIRLAQQNLVNRQNL
jgi:hypothetical protein